jgi:hypothetical protein
MKHPRMMCLVAALTSMTNIARADELRAADLLRASLILQQAANNGQSNRTGAIVLGLTTIGVLVPTGAVLLARGTDVPHIIGTGLTASGGGALLATLLSLPDSPAERLYTSFQSRRAAGMPADELLHRTEDEWREEARVSANRRALLGTIETVAGSVFAVGGAVVLLAPPIAHLRQRAQYSIGAILAGSGVPLLSLGIHSLFVKTPAEVSWAAYSAGNNVASARAGLSLAVTGIVGGSEILLSATF